MAPSAFLRCSASRFAVCTLLSVEVNGSNSGTSSITFSVETMSPASRIVHPRAA